MNHDDSFSVYHVLSSFLPEIVFLMYLFELSRILLINSAGKNFKTKTSGEGSMNENGSLSSEPGILKIVSPGIKEGWATSTTGIYVVVNAFGTLIGTNTVEFGAVSMELSSFPFSTKSSIAVDDLGHTLDRPWVAFFPLTTFVVKGLKNLHLEDLMEMCPFRLQKGQMTLVDGGTCLVIFRWNDDFWRLCHFRWQHNDYIFFTT